ncbi:MAG: outer membrane beta-barrel protein, partial [Bacteroidetes bacterium]|nr:outer membrane beta-barrel protein [Bacteroidota bacterium]
PEEKNIDGIAGKSKINKEAVSGKRDEADLSPNSKNNRSEKNKHDIIADINLPKKDPPIDRATGKNKQQQKKSAPWRISINSLAGISNVFGSGLSSSYVSGPLFSFQNGGYALAPGTAYYPPSKIGPYLSAGFGLAAEKKIAKKFSVSAGIRYRFYSTRVSALQFVDSSTYVYVSSNNLLQVNGYYVPGSKNYVNFYHFLELPVLINMQINKSEKHPLLWQAGFSVSYLMATNALHFDPSGNIYYKDKSLFNKAQANLVTGIMLGSPFYKGELRYGLQFQYGLTRLLNKQAGDTEHLFFAGIGLSYLLPKK